jgi:hypothetical protein
MRKLQITVVLSACSWTSVLLIMNRGLFQNKLIETGDQATILYQVWDAEHFRELLGNYSRWLFHHPGPGFMYILALGDTLFRRWLRLCPEPTNAAYLTLLLLNAAFLFASIWIFARHCRSSLFVPLAVLLCLWAIYVIDRTYGPVAVSDVWMPHILLFVFLLFAVTCASVATGDAKDLPVMVASGGLLIHGHVAQLLFVAVLSCCAFTTLYWVSLRKNPLRTFFDANRRAIAASAALIAIFVAPILLEAVVDRPDNLQKIQTYLSVHKGEHNRFLDAVKYEVSFFTFTPSPETNIANSLRYLIATAVEHRYILCYWIMAAGLAGLAIGTVLKGTQLLSPFFVYIGFEVLLISVLFLYWARRITGPLFAFNGYFYYSVQFLVLLMLAAVFLDRLQVRLSWAYSAVLACALPVLMFAAPSEFSHVGWNPAAVSDPWSEQAAENTQRIADSLPHQQSRIRIRVPDGFEGFLLRTGIASRLHWADQPICLDDKWVFLLEDRDRCQHVEALLDLEVEPGSQPGIPWKAELRPFPTVHLPFTIDSSASNNLTLKSYARESFPGGPIWSTNRLVMRFLLSTSWTTSPYVRVEIRGFAVKGRPVRVTLNGEQIGLISASGFVTSDFVIPASLFKAGQENEIAFEAANLSQAKYSNRNLAFDVGSILFSADPPNTNVQ